jgi:uncharacterized protein YcnI
VTRFLHAFVAVLLGVVGAVVVAAPASAHTTATAEPATAGAQNAVVSFYAAAESTSAGITSLKIVLPDGISPADVTYVDGPAGWALQTDADGYVVSGPAVPVARDVQHRVRVKQLPLVPALVFKILQTYSDGKIDRWIEVPSGANANPENPAPVVQLAAPPGGFPNGTQSNVPTPASTDHGNADDLSPGPLPANPPTAADEDEDDGRGTAWVVVGVAVLVLLAGGAFLLMRARRPGVRSGP